MPICTQGMQRTWCPEAGTIIVTGPYCLKQDFSISNALAMEILQTCFIMCWQRPGLVYQAISYWQNHARMANSQNVAISGEISSAILNIWCRFISEKVFEIINSQKSHANWICYDGWTPLDQPRFGFPVGEVPTCTWRFNSLLPIMTP